MSNAYENCIGDSPKYQSELEAQLNNQESTDVVTHYESVARAFPSNDENPYSLDIPQIDHESLKLWANTKGWDVKLAPEMGAEGSKNMPPVRFIKRT